MDTCSLDAVDGFDGATVVVILEFNSKAEDIAQNSGK